MAALGEQRVSADLVLAFVGPDGSFCNARLPVELVVPVTTRSVDDGEPGTATVEINADTEHVRLLVEGVDVGELNDGRPPRLDVIRLVCGREELASWSLSSPS